MITCLKEERVHFVNLITQLPDCGGSDPPRKVTNPYRYKNGSYGVKLNDKQVISVSDPANMMALNLLGQISVSTCLFSLF